MLGKLIKHQLKSTSRIIIPSIITWLIIAVLDKIALMLIDHENVSLITLINVLFVFLSISISIVVFIAIILYIYRSHIGNSGYLTFTLPVRTETIVLSNIISATVWEIICLLLLYLCPFTILNNDEIEYFNTDILPHFTFLTPNFFVAFIIYAITAIIFTILILYLSVAIASLFDNHKLILSFTFYICFNIMCNYLTNMFFFNNSEVGMIESGEEIQLSVFLDMFNQYLTKYFSPYSLLLASAFILAISAVLFIVISKIFKKHLNLQ